MVAPRSLRDNGDRILSRAAARRAGAPADTIDPRGGEAMQAVLEVLTADEQAQVHERTLKVLWEHGMRVDPDEGRRALAAAGAQVDEATRMVRFPPRARRGGDPPRPEAVRPRGAQAGLLLPPQRRRFHAARRRRGDDAARPPHRRAPRPHARGLDRGDDPHRRLRRRRPLLVALPPPVRRPGSARLRRLPDGRLRDLRQARPGLVRRAEPSLRGSSRCSTSCSAAATRSGGATRSRSSSRRPRR